MGSQSKRTGSKSVATGSKIIAPGSQLITQPDLVMETLKTGGGFGFSVTKPTALVDYSTEFTLACIILDISPSVNPFKAGIRGALIAAIKGCQMSPRIDSIMARAVLFNSVLEELHGYVPVGTIDPDAYKQFECAHLTALHDAIGEAVDSMLIYGKRLRDSDFTVNGCLYAVTDGLNNDSSKYDVDDLCALFKDAVQGEKIESLLSVLVGVNADEYIEGRRIGDVLQELQQKVGITQYIDIGKATPKELAKLGGHISKSVSSQSMHVHSGGPSQPVPF